MSLIRATEKGTETEIETEKLTGCLDNTRVCQRERLTPQTRGVCVCVFVAAISRSCHIIRADKCLRF